MHSKGYSMSLFFLLLLLADACQPRSNAVMPFEQRANIHNTVGYHPCTTVLTSINAVENEVPEIVGSDNWQELKKFFLPGDELLEWSCRINRGQYAFSADGYAIQRKGKIIYKIQWPKKRKAIPMEPQIIG